MYTISMYSNAISLIVKSSWYDCMWNNISIQSRCNRSLSFGSKCHYSTRFTLFLLCSLIHPLPLFHHTSDFVIFINRCSHFHAIILPFSVIYLLFGHFSYVVRFKFSFFIHSIYSQKPSHFICHHQYILCPHQPHHPCTYFAWYFDFRWKSVLRFNVICNHIEQGLNMNTGFSIDIDESTIRMFASSRIYRNADIRFILENVSLFLGWKSSRGYLCEWKTTLSM